MIEFHFLLKARDLPRTSALFEVRTGAVTQEEMLKMKDDPDELLKTKGKFRTENTYPDGCLKIKELRDNYGISGNVIESKRVSANSSPQSNVSCSQAEGRGIKGCGETPVNRMRSFGVRQLAAAFPPSQLAGWELCT